ncbi:hypothetical protein RFN57_36235 [Streptomyces violaceochromogenes]|uniref:Uncharacterized protein n=1 Tax=Streptomyces violaceochromogenes TaxID=67377 RepID=A0ABU6MA48_9ACTN|nr:hypothetical protein [Streptomyces violaceochromogenes]MEC7057697.1 hypothetical protein [Streptomyces violaceochromogenes]GHC52741.1 hypothetical protein GCM10010309_10210 [Streptomyces violaceochromogenes]
MTEDQGARGNEPTGRRRRPLASVPVGGQICVRHASGDIALLTVQTKQTALPELAALTMDMAIRRRAAA